MAFRFDVTFESQEDHIGESDDVTIHAIVKVLEMDDGWYVGDAGLVLLGSALELVEPFSEQELNPEIVGNSPIETRIALQSAAGDPEDLQFTSDSFRHRPPAPEGSEFEPVEDRYYELGPFLDTGANGTKKISFVLKTGSRIYNTPNAIRGKYAVPCLVEYTAVAKERGSVPVEVKSWEFVVQD